MTPNWWASLPTFSCTRSSRELWKRSRFCPSTQIIHYLFYYSDMYIVYKVYIFCTFIIEFYILSLITKEKLNHNTNNINLRNNSGVSNTQEKCKLLIRNNTDSSYMCRLICEQYQKNIADNLEPYASNKTRMFSNHINSNTRILLTHASNNTRNKLTSHMYSLHARSCPLGCSKAWLSEPLQEQTHLSNNIRILLTHHTCEH